MFKEGEVGRDPEEESTRCLTDRAEAVEAEEIENGIDCLAKFLVSDTFDAFRGDQCLHSPPPPPTPQPPWMRTVGCL